jgi:hypothetical protein
MSTITVRNPALFDRLRIQALLRSISDQRGEPEMLRLLQQALTTEFARSSKYSHDQDRLRQETP